MLGSRNYLSYINEYQHYISRNLIKDWKLQKCNNYNYNDNKVTFILSCDLIFI